MPYRSIRHDRARRPFRASERSRRSSPWDATPDDLAVMAALTARLGAPPVSNMMRYCGPEAAHLVRLGDSLGDWGRMLEVLARTHPDLPKPGPAAEDGTVLESAPERIVYETLADLLPDDLHLVLHPKLERGRNLRSDFGLCAPDDDTPVLCLEVMGMLGSDEVVTTAAEQRALDRLSLKERWFAQPGRPLLRVVWLDMLARPDWFEAVCDEAIQAALAAVSVGTKRRR